MKNFEDACSRVLPIIETSMGALKEEVRDYQAWYSRLQESNLTFLSCVHLKTNGFRTYLEVPMYKDKNIKERRGRIDAIAFNDANTIGLLIESKYLKSSESSVSLNGDLSRMKSHGPMWDGTRQEPTWFGLVLASTWNSPIKDWWLDKDRKEAPGRQNSEYWRNVYLMLKSGKSNGIRLLHKPDNKKYKEFCALWCLFPLECVEIIE